MAQQNEEHFEIIEKNKIERYERQKLTYLEDRVKVLERTLESHAKILARFQMTENQEQGFKDIATKEHDYELI